MTKVIVVEIVHDEELVVVTLSVEIGVVSVVVQIVSVDVDSITVPIAVEIVVVEQRLRQ